MKIVRFIHPFEKTLFYGVLENDYVYSIVGDPFSDEIDICKDKKFNLKPSEFLVPCEPSKVIALAINYHGVTGQRIDMPEPVVFLKGSNTVVKHDAKVKLPFQSDTWGESELGLVIKKEVSPESQILRAKDYILGYIATNDVSCKNIDGRDHHLARSKSANGFCPVGYYIDTEYDYRNKKIRGFHNEQLLRQGNTNQMIWNPEKILIWLSGWMTLNAGDIIITGTPARIRDRIFLKSGDQYKVQIEGLPDLNTFFYEK